MFGLCKIECNQKNRTAINKARVPCAQERAMKKENQEQRKQELHYGSGQI